MNSLMAVFASVIGAPFYFCAMLQAASLVLAVTHFGREHCERQMQASA